jgi:hypothetical protein
MDLYIHSPIRLHGIVLTYLSTGIILPYLLFKADDKMHVTRGNLIPASYNEVTAYNNTCAKEQNVILI